MADWIQSSSRAAYHFPAIATHCIGESHPTWEFTKRSDSITFLLTRHNLGGSHCQLKYGKAKPNVVSIVFVLRALPLWVISVSAEGLFDELHDYNKPWREPMTRGDWAHAVNTSLSIQLEQ